MRRKHSILIVEDEKNTREGLLWSLEGEKYDLAAAANAEEALERIRSRQIDLIVTDLRMPGMDGMKLLDIAREEYPSIEVIILTGHGTVEGAVEAIKKGAFDYLLKPVNLDELHLLVDRVLLQHDLKEENEALREELEERHGFGNIIGRAPRMQEVFLRVRQVAPTRASVLLTGESGTGKEVIAGAIHYNSPRKHKRFIKLNCGALTTTLLESELFGHEAGAFTDARKQKIGRFEMADGGTIFLDEITETAPEFQIKLLRVLQEQEFERVGGVTTIGVDVRVIAATNQNIEDAVSEGRFREDLYYRLNVVKIELPPLREREEDIPLLAQAFLKEFCETNGKPPMKISPKALAALRLYSWPGNVRQLRNVIEGLVVMTSGKEIMVKNLPDEVRSSTVSRRVVQLRAGASLADMEREMIRVTLEENNGNRAATARALGVGRKTLYRKIEEYGL
ncbi:MAG TPA: sigma-54 dependent transcriptional regulator [Sumerlaeia bacterium]|nr:sigma-54 dependent transcriptional regulator [Sumerlaeia bacterium]